MVEKRLPLPIEEAVRRVLQEMDVPVRTESVPFLDATQRFLAADLVADHDVPPFDRSPYDGYALRSFDTAQASRTNPVRLKTVGEIGAGTVFAGDVKAGETVRIMTGAKIPNGCDAVAMLEFVKEESDGYITVVRPFAANTNISFQGEDTRKGTPLVKKGSYVHPGVAALLATFGYNYVPVAVQPTVGILSMGSELLEVGAPLTPGKIRNSNAYMIAAQVRQAGGQPVMYGQLPDDLKLCEQAVRNMLEEVDIVITTGGASVGDYDLVPQLIETLGAKQIFNKVAMRPGSVTTAAHVGGKPFFGLSGNPGACFVGCELFVRPLIRRSLQAQNIHLKKSKAILAVDFPKPNPFTRLVRGILSEEDGIHKVAPSGLDKSGSVISLAEADVLIMLPGGTRGYQSGMEVDILLLGEQQGSEWPWKSVAVSSKS
ncbi:gephyrin-like molybdotransferase Glp [Bacillus sp. FSL K6-0047]